MGGTTRSAEVSDLPAGRPVGRPIRWRLRPDHVPQRGDLLHRRGQRGALSEVLRRPETGGNPLRGQHRTHFFGQRDRIYYKCSVFLPKTYGGEDTTMAKRILITDDALFMRVT